MLAVVRRLNAKRILLATVVCVWVFTGSVRSTGAQDPAPTFATLSGTAYRLVDQTIVDGYVVDETEVPVKDRRIVIPEMGIDEPLAEDGTFSLANLPVSAGLDSPTEVTVIFTGDGVGSFTYEHLRLYPGELGWILTPQLIDIPRVNDRRDAHVGERDLEREQTRSDWPSPDSGRPSGLGCFPLWQQGVFPETIRVWQNRPGQDQMVHVVDFEYYLRSVLPNEWIPAWNDQSIWAGAVAVKSYAWFHATHGPGHSHANNPGPECYDVDATDYHQIFDPSMQHGVTNTFVDLTSNYYMFKDDGTDVIEARYEQGFGDICGQFNGDSALGDKMSAWGSHSCADLFPVSGEDILNIYYFPPPVSWRLIHAPIDTDGDGCINGAEVGSDQNQGGLRNPLNPWDYYDTDRDKIVTLQNDIVPVIGRFQTPIVNPNPDTGLYYAAIYDRGPTVGPYVWSKGPPDNIITLQDDINGVIQQYGHSCA